MRRLKFYLFMGWMLFLAYFAAQRYPVPLQGGLSVLRSVGCLILLLGAMLALGRSLLLRFKIFFGSLTEEACFSLGLGAFALSSAFFLLSYFASAFTWVAWVSVGICLLVGFEHVEHFTSELRHALNSKHPWEGSSIEILTILAVALSTLAVLGLCLAPVSFYDALVYHLAIPLRTAALGVNLPQNTNLFSWLPGGMEQLWTLCQLLDGDSGGTRLAQLLNFSLYIALGLSVMDAGARFLPVTRLWLPVALLLTQPMVAMAFGVFSPDGAAAFFTFLSLYAFLNQLRIRNHSKSGGWLKLSALLAGFAVAVKPIALIYVVVLLVLLAVRAFTEADERRPGLLLSCVGLFVLPLLPWLLRNFMLTSNPVFPFAVPWLGMKPASASYLEHMASFGSNVPLWRLVWTATFEPLSLGGNGHLSFIFLALLPACFFVRYHKELRWLAAYLVLGVIFWTLGPRVLRYALPAVPGLCLFAAFCLTEIEAWAVSKTWSLALRLLVIVTLVMNAGQIFLLSVKDFDPFPSALGIEKPEDYLARQGVSAIKAAAWLKAHGGANRGLILLGDSRTAYLPSKTLAATVFDTHPFRAWLSQSASIEDLDARLVQKGYDFVMINKREWARVSQEAGPHYDYFSSRAKEDLFLSWMKFHANDAQKAYRAEDLLIFAVKPNTKPSHS